MSNLIDRARGALLGMAVGEALGSPLEGLTPEAIEEKAGRMKGFVSPNALQPKHRAFSFFRSVYEDETQAALAVTEALVRRNGFDVDAFKFQLEELGRPIAGHTFGCFRRPRRNFRSAVRRMLAGQPWTSCGVHTAGSGAASRGVPIGVWFHDNPAERTRAAVEATLLTHQDPRACAGTAAVAAVVAAAVKADAKTVEPESLIEAAVAGARAAEDLIGERYGQHLRPGYEGCLHQFSEALSVLPEILDADVEEAFQRIVAMAADKGSRPILLATRGFSLTAVVTALYFVLTGLDSFEETLLDTVAEGGNSDTLGCLVGGMLGALVGESGIPGEWRDDLKNSDAVAKRGEAMVSEAARTSLASLVLSEAPLSRPPRPGGRKPGGGRDGRRGPPRPGSRGGSRRGGPPRGGGPRRGPGRGGPGRPDRGGPRGDGPRRGGYGRGGGRGPRPARPPGGGPARDRQDRRGPPGRWQDRGGQGRAPREGGGGDA